MRTLIVLVALASTVTAHADSGEVLDHAAHAATDTPPAHAVSLLVPALIYRALTVAYENNPSPLGRRFSVVAALGLHRRASGDYSSTNVSMAGELRFWFTGRELLWKSWAQHRAMVGGFAGLQIGLTYINTHNDIANRTVGNTATLTETVRVGYRFAILRRVEVTPSFGLQWLQDFELGSRLPPWSRSAITAGLSVGVFL